MLRLAVNLARTRAREQGCDWFVSIHVDETEDGGALFAIRVDPSSDPNCEYVVGVTPQGQRYKVRWPDAPEKLEKPEKPVDTPG